MFGTTWKHHLVIDGSSDSGSQDGDGGWDPGASVTPIYDGKCDAQEPSRGGLQVTTNDTQVTTETADLWIFLKDESKINDLAPDMKGTLTRGSREDRIVIKNIRLIDGMIEANTI